MAVGDVAKSILHLAGVKDSWGFARGHTKTTVNYALAVFDALKRTSEIRVSETQEKALLFDYVMYARAGEIPQFWQNYRDSSRCYLCRGPSREGSVI